jgi:predicted N-acetyltransferase YhbS
VSRQVHASGLEAVLLASRLLRRNRLAHPTSGLWEAADMQWWWRRERSSDEIEQLFWVDDDGPVAAALLTESKAEEWQCDPLQVAGTTSPPIDELWEAAIGQIDGHVVGEVTVAVRDDDPVLQGLAAGSGFVPGDSFTNNWIDASERPEVIDLPAGFTLVDRSQRAGTPHPFRHRNGDAAERRLRETPLYDPGLDLSIEHEDGRLAGYSLYWYDAVTRTGLVEPVRVEDEFSRRGLARAMITHGLDRLAARGAERVKIGNASEAAGALYRGLGFRPTTTDTTYAGRRDR